MRERVAEVSLLSEKKNVLEKAFALTTLLISGYEGAEIDMLLEDVKTWRTWKAYRFYRQRHPYRIFGSEGLTVAACLEALNSYITLNR